MNNFFDNQRILNLIWKRKFHFILIGIIAIVLAAIFSGPIFITPKFKSTARIYPTNLGEISEESKTEQMLEVINSNDIKFKMFDAFRLDTVYKISIDDQFYNTNMLDIYEKNVSTSKTEFETVEIKVLDHEAQRASDMCDSIIHFYNWKVGSMYKAKYFEMIEITGKQITVKRNNIDTVKTKLNKVRKETGIINYSQVPEVTRGYMNALATGRGTTSDAKKIEELYNKFVENGTEAYILETRLRYINHEIDSLVAMNQNYLSEFEKNITFSHLVESPFPADKKSYPVRWLIVALSTISAVFLALLVFLVLDYRKEEE